MALFLGDDLMVVVSGKQEQDKGNAGGKTWGSSKKTEFCTQSVSFDITLGIQI